VLAVDNGGAAALRGGMSVYWGHGDPVDAADKQEGSKAKV